MLSRLLCLQTLSSLCLSSLLDQFEKEFKKTGLDVDKIDEELKRESEDVEQEFAGKEELAELRVANSTSTKGTNEGETEMEINEELSEDLFEGDIILTPEQRARIIDRDDKATRQRRQALTDVRKMWSPMGAPVIPYSYFHGFPAENKKIVNESLEFWASRTCITFRPANDTDEDFIQFNHFTHRCDSYVGMEGFKQDINLAPECFTLAIITHELSHVFGTLHVHMRADRDEYITVNTENIKEGYINNFYKNLDLFTYDIPYEFGSLMHYRENRHAINITQPTIKAKDEYSKYQHSMGSPLASFYDVLLINRMYNCTDKCEEKISCENNGTQHGKDCNRCFCPKGWAGSRCEERPGDANVAELTGSREIEMVVDAAPQKGYAEKLYVIEAPVGKRINASIIYMEDYPDCSIFRFFEIIPTKDTRINGIRFCGDPDSTPTESDSNQMLVYMYNQENKRLKIRINFDLI